MANHTSRNSMGETAKKIAINDKNALNRRSLRRTNTYIAGTVLIGNDKPSLKCIIRDLSEEGARIKIENADLIPDNVTLVNPRDFAAYDATVKWRCGNLLGLAFDNAILLDY